MNSTFLTSKTWNITCFKFFRSQQKCNPNRPLGILLHLLNETFHKSNLRKSLFLRNQLADRQKKDILRKVSLNEKGMFFLLSRPKQNPILKTNN